MLITRSKLLFFLVSIILAISGCDPVRNTPVIFHIPSSEMRYTFESFSPHIEFPEGMPSQDRVVLRLNGVDIASEFDLWGEERNIATMKGRVDDGSYPLTKGALKDGMNFIQLTFPPKDGFYFYIDRHEAENNK